MLDDPDEALCLVVTRLPTSRSSATLFDGDAGVQTSLSDYLRCGPRGTCPTSGELILTRLPDGGRTRTLQFDDDRTAWVPDLEANAELDGRE